MDKLKAAISGVETTGSPARAFLAGASVFLFSFCCLAAFWYKQVRLYYFPSGDEFSLLINSAKPFHPAISGWVLHGFSRYFIPYPEWGVPVTNFLRPIANAEYYLDSLLFGSRWSMYLLSNYVIQSVVVACAVYISIRHLRLRPPAVLVIGLVCFFSPAFDSGALFSTAFPFDLLAACFVLAGLSFLLSGRLFPAWLCFAVGIFTKETALFAPFAAALALYMTSLRRGSRRFPWHFSRYPGGAKSAKCRHSLTERLRAALFPLSPIGKNALAPVFFLLPYALWEALRWIAFHGTTGIYAVGNGHPDLVRLTKNLLHWPIPFEAPLDIKLAFGLVPVSFPVCAFAALNLCFWVFLAGFLLGFGRSHVDSMHHKRKSANSLLGEAGFVYSAERILLLFCAGSAAILLLIPNLAPRFGATFVPLFALSLAVVFEKGTREIPRVAALCFLIIPLVTNVAIRATGIAKDLRTARFQWSMSSDYIRKISRSSAPAIFTVDDVTGGYSSTESVSKFAGYTGKLVRIDDLFLGPNCEAQPQIEARRISDSKIEIVSTINSSCAGHTFCGAEATPIGGNPLSRNVGLAEIDYHGMPALPEHAVSVPGQLIADIRHAPAASVILLPDLRLHTYREVRFDEVGK